MKILFICAHERYHKCPNRTYRDIVYNYQKNGKFNTELVFTDNNYSESDFNESNPDIVIFFEIDSIRYGGKYEFVFKKKVYVCSLDYFYFNKCTSCKYIQKCSGVITYPDQEKIMDSYKRIFPDKQYLSFDGRFINSSIYKNYGNTKKYDVLIYGTIDFTNPIEKYDTDEEYITKWENYNEKTFTQKRYLFYPLRFRIKNLLDNNPKYNLKILEQCGSLSATKYVNESLSKLINESWLTLCTSSRANILMDKYIEVAGSYSGILGNIPTDYEELFKDNIIEVTEWMTDEEILATIDKALENKQKLQEMIDRLGHKIHEEFSLEASINKMDKVFEIFKNL